jgi:type VI secretion system FHA domain protein
MGPGDDLDDLLGDFVPAPGPTTATPPARPQPATAPQPQPWPQPAIATPPAAAEAPSVSPAPVPSPIPAAALPVAATPQNGAALLAAFAEAAGIPQLDLGSADPQAAMRAFVTGTREVLMSRAEIKHEMRVEQTMMRPRDNNALKFSVSTAEALAALLQPGRPGYKPPLAAVEEAFNDIRSHEMAVMAGLQTALIALLKRFDPAALEGRLQRGMLDAVLPAARKARFWELFCATYKDIASEAQDDFHSIFGSEFARAYDAQIRKL